MNKLNIMEIASKKVLTISEEKSILDAIEMMYSHNHRDIIVVSPHHKKYGLLSATDLIKMKKMGLDFHQQISTILYPTVQTIHEKSSVLDALTMLNHRNYPMCVVDEEDTLVGFVSYYDIISSLDPSMMLEKRYVGELLVGAELKKASQEMSLCDVIGLMDDSMYDCVVLEDAQKGVGIITTKDVLRLFNEQSDLDKPASTFMSTPLLTITFSTTIKDALDFIKDKNFKRLIITNDNGETIGQITQEELLSRIYSRWASVMRSRQNVLEEANKNLFEKATQFEIMSVTDKLTGIYNRGKFEVELNNEIQRVTRYGSDVFSLIFYDIDNFKKINDTYGHAIGDEVIKGITNLFKKMLRATDVFARWGGEEFAIIMPHTSLANALNATEKLRKVLEETKFTKVGYVTCSFGVTEYKEEDTAHSLVIRVDDAMYKAKKGGKNKVEAL